MKIILILAAALAVTASQAHALTQAEARHALASGAYHLYKSEYSWDDVPGAQVDRLIAAGRYAEALPILHQLDDNWGEGENIDFVPDIAMVAAAAGNISEYTRFHDLAQDIQAAADAHAICRETADGYALEFPVKITLHDQEAATSRTCNGFMADQVVETSPDFAARLRRLG